MQNYLRSILGMPYLDEETFNSVYLKQSSDNKDNNTNSNTSNNEAEASQEDDNVDNDLFGWQTRYAYLKSRENCVKGMFSLPPSLDMAFSAYAQSRDFYSVPKLSNQFVTMSPNNLRRDYLAYPSQPAYKVQFASDISLVRALPYQSVPNTFGF